MSNKTEKPAEVEKPTIETNVELYVEKASEIEAVVEKRGEVVITTFVGEQPDATVNEAV